MPWWKQMILATYYTAGWPLRRLRNARLAAAGRAPISVLMFHRIADDAANTLTSPFAGITSDTSSEWTIHTVKLLLALAIYGFGLGFLARVLRVGT